MSGVLGAGAVSIQPRNEWLIADSDRATPLIGSSTFEVFLRRWVVVRSIACICRNRRLAKGYERKVQTSQCWLKVGMVRLMLERLGIVQ